MKLTEEQGRTAAMEIGSIIREGLGRFANENNQKMPGDDALMAFSVSAAKAYRKALEIVLNDEVS